MRHLRLVSIIIGIITIIAVSAIYMQIRDGKVVTMKIENFTHEDGYAYNADIGAIVIPAQKISLWSHCSINRNIESGDTDNALTRSTLQLFEEGKPLGPAHSPHDYIKKEGNGRFSHWNNVLYLSTSDNSNPRINGRTYTIKTRLMPSYGRKNTILSILALGIITCLTLFAFPTVKLILSALWAKIRVLTFRKMICSYRDFIKKQFSWPVIKIVVFYILVPFFITQAVYFHLGCNGMNNHFIQMTFPTSSDHQANPVTGYAWLYYNNTPYMNENTSVIREQCMFAGGAGNSEVYAKRLLGGFLSYWVPFLSPAASPILINIILSLAVFIAIFLFCRNNGLPLFACSCCSFVTLLFSCFAFHIHDRSAHFPGVAAFVIAAVLIMHFSPWKHPFSLCNGIISLCAAWYAYLAYPANLALMCALLMTGILFCKLRSSLLFGLGLVCMFAHAYGWNKVFLNMLDAEAIYFNISIEQWESTIKSGFVSIIERLCSLLYSFSLSEPITLLIVLFIFLCLFLLSYKKFFTQNKYNIIFLLFMILGTAISCVFWGTSAIARGYLFYIIPLSVWLFFIIIQQNIRSRIARNIIYTLTFFIGIYQILWIVASSFGNFQPINQFFLGSRFHVSSFFTEYIRSWREPFMYAFFEHPNIMTPSEFNELIHRVDISNLPRIDICSSGRSLLSSMVRVIYVLAPLIICTATVYICRKQRLLSYKYLILRYCTVIIGITAICIACNFIMFFTKNTSSVWMKYNIVPMSTNKFGYRADINKHLWDLIISKGAKYFSIATGTGRQRTPKVSLWVNEIPVFQQSELQLWPIASIKVNSSADFIHLRFEEECQKTCSCAVVFPAIDTKFFTGADKILYPPFFELRFYRAINDPPFIAVMHEFPVISSK